MAPIFLSILSISTFQYKAILTISVWIPILFHKAHTQALISLAKTHKQILFTTLILSFYITIVSAINKFQINNYLVATSLLAWIPTTALLMAAQKKNTGKVLFLLYLMLIAAQVLILFTLWWQRYGIGIQRPLGIGHNVISGPLICVLALITYDLGQKLELSSKVKNNLQWLKWISVIFISGSIVTNSRTAILCAAISIFYIIKKEQQKTKLHPLATIISFIILTSFLLRDRATDMISDIKEYARGNLYSSIGSRLEAYIWSYRNIEDHLLHGRSIEGITKSYNSRYAGEAKFVEFMPHLHNDFLQLTAAFGLSSAVIFYLLFVMLYRRHQSSSQGYLKVDKSQIKNSGSVIIICIFLTSLFDSLTFNIESLLAFMVVIGISLSVQSKVTPS
jgi:O-antigen ligase